MDNQVDFGLRRVKIASNARSVAVDVSSLITSVVNCNQNRFNPKYAGVKKWASELDRGP